MGDRLPLSFTNPVLAAELVDVDPDDVFQGPDNGTKFWWRCPNHPEPYSASLGNRIHRHSGCPYCKWMTVLPGFNDLATVRPDLAAELIDADPSQVLAGGSASHLWSCPNHEQPYRTTVKARINGHSCRFCNHIEALPGFNDLATTHPELAAELLDIDPTTITAGVGRPATWECPEGHRYVAKVLNRTSTHKTGCPYCSGRAVLVGFNDLASTHPQLAAELVVPDPKTVSAGSNATGSWVCPVGHSFEARILNRTSRSATGCPYCAGRAVLEGFNDLATTHPQLATELLEPEPTTVSAGSHTKGLWRCPKHDEPFSAVISNRVKGTNCGYCAGRSVLPGFNDLATVRPDLAVELLDDDPTQTLAGTSRKLKWRCPRGHEFVASGDSRTHATDPRGCPYCAGQKLLPGFNDLATRAPEIAQELVDVDPTTVNAGTNRRFTWKCRSCGKTWKASVSNRTRNESGCPSCAKAGYDPTKAGYLYLMARHGEQQVGITNQPKQRITTHRRNGWELLDLTDAMNGERVAMIEQQVRHWLRDQGWRVPGTFENWMTAHLEVSTLRELFDMAGVQDPAAGARPSR